MKIKGLIALGMLLMVTACSTKLVAPNGIVHPKPRTVSELVGQNRNQIRKEMGAPLIARVEGEHTLWSYATDDTHAVLVYFDNKGIVQHAETRADSIQSKK